MPNPIFPASGIETSTTQSSFPRRRSGRLNRRGFISGAIALGATTAAPCAANAGGTRSPLDDLIDKERELKTAHSSAFDIYVKVEDQYYNWIAEHEDDFVVSFKNWSFNPIYDDIEDKLAEFDAMEDRTICSMSAVFHGDARVANIRTFKAKAADFRSTMRAVHQRLEDARDTLGFTIASDDEHSAMTKLDEARYAILRYPAKNDFDLATKSRWLQERFREGGCSFDRDYADALLESFTG